MARLAAVVAPMGKQEKTTKSSYAVTPTRMAIEPVAAHCCVACVACIACVVLPDSVHSLRMPNMPHTHHTQVLSILLPVRFHK